MDWQQKLLCFALLLMVGFTSIAPLSAEDLQGPMPHDVYADLQKALHRYQKMAEQSEWPLVPPGEKLQKGDKGERVEVLHERLVTEGYLHEHFQKDIFDESVEEAVKSFQTQHGLEADGTFGAATLGALNVSVEKRIHQIRANINRWEPTN